MPEHKTAASNVEIFTTHILSTHVCRRVNIEHAVEPLYITKRSASGKTEFVPQHIMADFAIIVAVRRISQTFLWRLPSLCRRRRRDFTNYQNQVTMSLSKCPEPVAMTGC